MSYFALQWTNPLATSMKKEKKDMIRGRRLPFFLLLLQPINWQRISRTFVNHTISFLNIVFISQYFVTLNPHWTETTNQSRNERERERESGWVKNLVNQSIRPYSSDDNFYQLLFRFFLLSLSLTFDFEVIIAIKQDINHYLYLRVLSSLSYIFAE